MIVALVQQRPHLAGVHQPVDQEEKVAR